MEDQGTFNTAKTAFDGFVTAASDALTDAQEALDEAGEYTGTDAQNAALARAQTAFNDANTCNNEAIGFAPTATGYETAVGTAISDAETAENDAAQHKQDADDFVEDIVEIIDDLTDSGLDEWTDAQTLEASGCWRYDADVELVEVDGVLRMFIGINCEHYDHLYFKWRWQKNAWGKLKDSLSVSSGYRSIAYVPNNPDRGDDTIEISCWNSGSR